MAQPAADALRLDFDRRLKPKFHGSSVTPMQARSLIANSMTRLPDGAVRDQLARE